MAKSWVIVLFLAACSGGGSSKPATTTAPKTAAADEPNCPVAVPGTSVTTEDTATGAALVFVTTGDVVELRKRVAAMVAMHNEHHGAMGPLPTGTEQPGAHAGHDMSGHDMSGHDMSGHDMSGHDMSGHAGHDMSGHDMAGGGMIMVHSKAASEDVDGGAKLVLTTAPDGVAKLQSELRMHAQHLAGGTCKMDHH